MNLVGHRATDPGRVSRRQWLLHGTATLGLGSTLLPVFTANTPGRIRIGACDWSIGRMAQPSAFEVARDIGLDGVKVSLGTVKDGMQLRRPAVQRAYREAARASGLAVASLAIGELNNIPYKSDPRTTQWVSDSIDVCKALGCRVVLLAFFGNGDLNGDATGTSEVVRKLRDVAPKAETNGVVLGIESWLSAEEHEAIIQRVGSPAVQVYYDVANSEKMGYDIYSEIRRLGRQGLICEFHAKENGALLGHGRIDFRKVREAIDEIAYSGWIQIEGAVPEGSQMLPSYRANQAFLRTILS